MSERGPEPRGMPVGACRTARCYALLVPLVALCGMALGVAVLVGWWADIPALKTVLPDLADMKANTAVGIAALCGALWLLHAETGRGWRLIVGRGLAGFTVLLSTASLAQNFLNLDFGIDEWLVRDNFDAPSTASPGRMGLNTGGDFLLIGGALLLARADFKMAATASQLCATAAMALTFSALLGYVFGATALKGIVSFTPMGLHTAIAFALLSVCSLALTADRGFVAELRGDRNGSMLAKRLLPVIVVVIPIVGWFQLEGERFGLVGTEMGAALFSLFSVTALSLIIVVIALWLNRADNAQRRMVARLSESEAQFRGLVANIPGVVYQRIVSPDGTSRLAYVSPGVQALFGPDISPAAAMADATLLRRHFHPDDRARIDAARQAAYRDLSRFEVEGRIVTSDHRTKWVQNLSQPRRRPGGAAVWDGVIVDITARKEAERAREELGERMRQAQKMEAVGQLTGGVAHDFNNLLTIILGNIDLLTEQLGEDSARDRSIIDTIHRAGERGAGLTRRLLAFSRRQVLQPTKLDLNQIVGDLNNLLRRTLGESIETVTVCAPDLWPALADKSQVEEALLNLAVNARDAMPNGGKLMIETANVWLDESYASMNVEVKAGPHTMLAVSDTGTGMSRAVIERAFDPFFTTKGVGKGTGLGLSMIFGFAKQSGGHVKIYSEVGHGTVVKLYLPRGEGHAERVAVAAAEPSVKAVPGRRILLVEDEADVRTMVTTMLTRLGYEIVAAPDGPAALIELDKLASVDLLFTDVVLPRGMTGRELADEAVRRRPGLKVLFTSGYTANSIMHHGRLDEGVELISKPYRAADLARKIAAILAPAATELSRP